MTARFLDISAPHVQTPHCVAVEFVQTGTGHNNTRHLMTTLAQYRRYIIK